jgi:hypothetical protein
LVCLIILSKKYKNIFYWKINSILSYSGLHIFLLKLI